MMGLYRSVSGAIRLKILSGDIPHAIKMLERENIPAYHLQIEDAVTLSFTISRQYLKKLQRICERKGYTIQIVKMEGLFWPLRRLLSRPVLLIGMILLILAASFIPGRILFIRTEGHALVSTRYILEQAENCGLSFWVKRRDIRSERIKNRLLESIPQLQWVGVNTYGCRAVITVRERSAAISDETTAAVSHIVAARDGVVQSCTVTQGCRNCTVGQAVKTGDILISGYTDCGLTVTAEQAKGRIFAQTQRRVAAAMPLKCQMQSRNGASTTRFGLIIGKKRINFYKGSGISGGSCDKMYSKYVLTLPGGFALPVALLKESTISCYLIDAMGDSPDKFLENQTDAYLLKQMTNGTLLRKSEVIEEQDGVLQLTGVYDCLEEIGMVQNEMIGEFHGKTNGTDR